MGRFCMSGSDTRDQTPSRNDGPDEPGSGRMLRAGASGWIAGFVIGWLLFDDIFWGLLFGFVLGSAFSAGQRIEKR